MKMRFELRLLLTFLKILILLSISFGYPAFAKAGGLLPSKPQAHHFRVLIQKTGLKFILTSKQALQYTTKLQTKPTPLFTIDIPRTHLSGSVKKTPLSSDLVKSFQMSKQANGHLQISFELTQPMTPKISRDHPHSYQHQLLVEFTKHPTTKKLDIPLPKFLAKASKLEAISLTPAPKKVHSAAPPIKTTPTEYHEPVKLRGKRDIIVVIDPGHGGKDPGAIGRSGYHEKMVVLSIAKRLANQINRQPGFRAQLTRHSDYYIGLRDRLAIARRVKADLFISIHADAFHNPTSHGVSVFALSQRGATSEAARWLAQRENISETLGDEKLTNKDYLLSSVLINLSQNHAIAESVKIGESMLKHFNSFSKLHHRHVEQAAFVVLKSPDIPSLLVETGFLSNHHEEKRLTTPWYQERVAHALMIGIKQYFLRNPPPGTLIALKQAKSFKF